VIAWSSILGMPNLFQLMGLSANCKNLKRLMIPSKLTLWSQLEMEAVWDYHHSLKKLRLNLSLHRKLILSSALRRFRKVEMEKTSQKKLSIRENYEMMSLWLSIRVSLSCKSSRIGWQMVKILPSFLEVKQTSMSSTSNETTNQLLKAKFALVIYL
jgi:hypothetical protein